MRPWKVMIVDDHQLMRDAIQIALAGDSDFDVVAEARSGDEALELASTHHPDVVLLDLQMPGLMGLDCLALLKRDHDVKVVVFSGADDPVITRRALEAGADAYLSKHVDPRDLTATLRQVIAHTVFAPLPDVGDSASVAEAVLTQRELEVLRHVANGVRTREIGRLLSVSENTVKYHLARIYAKLGVSGRVEAVNAALNANLIDVELDGSAH